MLTAISKCPHRLPLSHVTQQLANPTSPHPRFLVATSCPHLLAFFLIRLLSFSHPLSSQRPLSYFPSRLPLVNYTSGGSCRSDRAFPGFLLWTSLPVASNTDTLHLPSILFAFYPRTIPGRISREAPLAVQLTSFIHHHCSALSSVGTSTVSPPPASSQHQIPPCRQAPAPSVGTPGVHRRS